MVDTIMFYCYMYESLNKEKAYKQRNSCAEKEEQIELLEVVEK